VVTYRRGNHVLAARAADPRTAEHGPQSTDLRLQKFYRERVEGE